MKEKMISQRAMLVTMVFSCTTMLSCLIVMSLIYNDISNIWAELDSEMNAFKVNLGYVHKLMKISPVFPSNFFSIC